MKPRGSRLTSAGSQSVCGCAPIMRKRPTAGTVSSWPLAHVAKHEMVEPSVLAATADDLGAEPDLHVRRGLHLAREIVRHAHGERIRADHERHAPREAREVERRLAGRVRSAEDVDVVAGHAGSLGGRARRRRRPRRSSPRAPGRRVGDSWRPWQGSPRWRARRCGRTGSRRSGRPRAAVRAPAACSANFAPSTQACSYACSARRPPLMPPGKPR